MSIVIWTFLPLTVISLSLYAGTLLRWRKGMQRIFSRNSVPEKKELDIGISIVVPVRNEAGYWEELFEDLRTQRVHEGIRWELLFVDDASSDGSREKLREWSGGASNIELLEMPEGEEGKKRALRYGIRRASYEWILTLDADVRIGPDFLKGTANHLQQGKAELFLLPVLPHSPKGFRQHFIYYEALALCGVQIGSVGIGAPALASGAGMAFRRSLFKELGEYQEHLHIDSGDDVFFLQEALLKGKGIGVGTQGNLLVRTRSPFSIKERLQQQFRWAAKARAFKDPRTIWSFAVVGGMNSFLIFNLLLALFQPFHFALCLIVWGIKGGLDRIFLTLPLQRLGKGFSWKHFPLALLLYPFQVVLLPIIGLFWNPVWKGRRIGSH